MQSCLVFSLFLFLVWAVKASDCALLTVLVDLSHSTVDSSHPCLVFFI